MLLAYWGRGYATEAARAIVAFAAEHAGRHRLPACVASKNARSIAVATKIGLRLDTADPDANELKYDSDIN